MAGFLRAERYLFDVGTVIVAVVAIITLSGLGSPSATSSASRPALPATSGRSKVITQDANQTLSDPY
jgi:hypothetical protein